MFYNTKRSLCMQISSVSSSATFTGVIPVKVHIDGKEALDSANIQKGCRKLIETLAGPIENDTEKQRICKIFAGYDKDYSFHRALKGYKCFAREYGRTVKKTASHFFRFINLRDKNFIVTGKVAEELAEKGKNLGKAKSIANDSNIPESYEVMAAKRIYGDLIRKITSNRALRIREGYDRETRQNTGNETILNIFLKSNGKYGQTNFKLNLDNIVFSVPKKK